MRPPDPYAVLGVPRTADDDAIKAAFRRIALEAHPDRCGPGASPSARAAAAARFAAASAAYEVLSDGMER
jgi:DnaJ like chaperone protein